MAETTGKINGTELLVYVGANPVACTLSSTIDLGTEVFDITSKDSDGWREILPGIRNWSISGDGLTQFDASYGFNDLVDVWKNRTMITVSFKTSNADDKIFTGSAYITAISESAPVEDVTSYTFTFQGTSVLTYAVVS